MIKRAVSLALTLVLAGCAGIEEAETKIRQDQHAAEALRALVESNATNGSVIRSGRQRIAGEEVTVRSNPLPAVFDEKISYMTAGAQSLVQTLEDISQSSGMAIRTAEIADLSRGVQGGIQGGEALTGNISLEFTGTRRGLFDEIAGKANVSWRYNRATRAVELFRFETRTLSVHIPPGAQTIAANISLAGVSGGGGSGSGSSSGGSGASSGNVSVSQNLTIDPWTSIMAGVNSILANGKSAGASQGMAAAGPGASGGGGGSLGGSGGEGSAIANQDLGLMTVTARPVVLDRVARYLNSINERFAQNILIDAKVMTVTLNEQTSGGFNLNMLYNPISKLGGSIVGPGPVQAGGASPGILTLAPKDPNSRFAGSSLVFDALSQFGTVSLQQQAQTLAVNGQPAPMQVADEINYKSGQTVVPQNGNQAAIIAPISGTKVVGFTANFVPLILGDNRISLAYQLNLSALTSQTTDPDGTQHPQISSKSLPGHAFMRDGQAIVLFGYGQQRDGVDSALHPAGYSKAATKSRQLTVIVVQVNTGVKNEQN